ncbi:recombinase family protein [Bacillus cereus group sp. BcHK130]|nr:recombinase family protein [Bacillus cereus group sp. BcHK130]MDA1928715.1 recombinase family protein [Bacillus cereus group sp. BcHK130]
MRNVKKVAIYARVSTTEQAEKGYSIDAQIETVKKKCELAERIVIREYVDRGISGKSIEKRVQLQQLIRDAKSGEFEEVWVWKTNRLARNNLDLLKVVDILEKSNVSFKSCTEEFDTSTAAGKLLLSVLASLGEFERKTIVENVQMGMKKRARLGKWNGGQVLGYKSVKDNGDSKKSRLQVVEAEAEIVRMIFNLYAGGKGLKSLVNHINKLGYKSKKGNMFAIATIRDILHNPLYIGKIRYNKMQNWSEKRRKGKSEEIILVEGEHEAIIDIDLWDKVQSLYKKKSYKPVRNYSGSYPLTGILKCPECGGSMVAGKTKRKLKDGSYKIHQYYYCGEWRNKGIAACHSNGVRKNEIEECVFKKIREVLVTKTILKDVVDRMNKKRRNITKPKKERLEYIDKKIKELELKKNKIFDLYEEGIFEKEDLSERMKSLSNQIKCNLEERDKLQQSVSGEQIEPIDYKLVKRVLDKFNQVLATVENEKKKLILNLVIQKIELDEQRKLKKITFAFDDQIKKYIFNEKEGESVDGTSSFSFSVVI